MEIRPFGQTGESFPILSFGEQRIVDEHNCTENEAIDILNTAIDRGIRYFDTVIVGMETMKQLKQNLSIAESFKPMTDVERLVFFQDIIDLVKPQNMRWKAEDWDNPDEWILRERGRKK